MKSVKIMALLAGIFLLFVGISRAEKKPTVRFGNFTALEVEEFENPKYDTTDAMPDGWVVQLREAITQRAIRNHQFHRVGDYVDADFRQTREERVLLLRGEILEFSRGSQAKRFLIGMGAGKGKVVAMCYFVDKATGDVVWERKVDGRVINFGASTEGALQGLAKEVAKYLRMHR